METKLWVTSAFAVIFYCASTEILDATGRIEIISRYFPDFPEFLATRTFRLLLLAAIGGLQVSLQPVFGR